MLVAFIEIERIHENREKITMECENYTRIYLFVSKDEFELSIEREH